MGQLRKIDKFPEICNLLRPDQEFKKKNYVLNTSSETASVIKPPSPPKKVRVQMALHSSNGEFY